MKINHSSSEFHKLRINLISAVKIGLGSALAIFIAAGIGLPNPASAGTITLLTLIAQTRKDTVQLILRRLVSFVLTVLICWLVFPLITEMYLAYALFLIIIVFLMEVLGWQATLSVNAVIAAHFLLNKDFSVLFVSQQLALLIIGITIALVLNLIQPDLTEREHLKLKIDQVEKELQEVISEVADSLLSEEKAHTRRRKLPELHKDLLDSINTASRYQKNTYRKEDQWFLNYFEMRMAQCLLLEELYSHAGDVCRQTKAGNMVVSYMVSLIDFITEHDQPVLKYEEGQKIRRELIESFSETDNFENDSMLLFVMLDLQKFVELKKRFIESLSKSQLESYQQRTNLLKFKP